MTADPTRRSPLEHRPEDLELLGAHELPFLAQASLRLEALEALGPHPLLPPTAPNTWTTLDGRELLWLGPDEWLIVGSQAPSETLAWLEQAFDGLHRSVVDVSANRAAIELTADDRRDQLAAGCGLDLHPRSWGDGMCAQTLLGRVPVLLQERDRSTRVFVRPSFADSLVDWLLAVANAERPA